MAPFLVRLLRGRSVVIAVPMLFLLGLFLLPFAIVGQISVSDMENTCCKDIRSEERRGGKEC